MKFFISLCLIVAISQLNGCAVKQSSDFSENTALKLILSCAADKLFICTVKRCRSIPIIGNETDPYPLTIDVKQNKIFNMLLNQDIKESTIVKSEMQGNDLLIWGQSSSIDINQEMSDWLMRIHPSRNTFELAGLTQSNSIVLYGHCEEP